jgi:hypothetical protein
MAPQIYVGDQGIGGMAPLSDVLPCSKADSALNDAKG